MPPEAQLTGGDKAAILLMAMGEVEAAQVLKHMSPKEVQALGTAISGLGRVTQENLGEVLDEFAENVRNQSSLGLGGQDYLRNVLTLALGPERASSVLPEILTSNERRGLEALRWMGARDIADVLVEEHPQVIALALLHLEEEPAAEVLKLLPEATQADVVLRIAKLDGVHPSALRELDEVLGDKIEGNQDLVLAQLGGADAAAKLLSSIPGSMGRRIVECITESQPELVEELEGLMFNFETLIALDDRSVQTLLRDVQSENLVLALKGSSDEMKSKIFGNMSARAADLLRDDLEARGSVRLNEVEAAQKEILDTAKRLAEEGQLTLPGQDDDYV